jgi:hypothetical protein
MPLRAGCPFQTSEKVVLLYEAGCCVGEIQTYYARLGNSTHTCTPIQTIPSQLAGCIQPPERKKGRNPQDAIVTGFAHLGALFTSVHSCKESSHNDSFPQQAPQSLRSADASSHRAHRSGSGPWCLPLLASHLSIVNANTDSGKPAYTT